MIKLVWAQTQSGVIGLNNQLPWKIPQEMQFFKNYTTNKTILMGRKTFEAIGSKPLKNRHNLVLSHKLKLEVNYSNLEVINDVNDIIKKFHQSDEELIVIGGSKVYEIFVPFADKLIVSIIKEEYFGDTKFPQLDWNDFQLYEEIDHLEFIIKKYERTK